MTENAKHLLKEMYESYKETNKNEFNIEFFLGKEDYQAAISELKESGYLIERDNILQTLSIDLDLLG